MKPLSYFARVALFAPPRAVRSFRRTFASSAARAPPSPAFTAAAEAVNKLPVAPSSEDKLRLYALFKQATQGPNDTPKPGMMDVVGKYKWRAWADLGEMPQAEAEAAYIALCQRLGAAAGGGGAPARDATSPRAPPPASSSPAVEIADDPRGFVRTITLNRPEKRNALSVPMYEALTAALREAAADASLRVVVLTGRGSYYCAGNDLSNFTAALGPEGPEAFAERSRAMMEAFVEALFALPQLLVVAANGPAVGLPVTTLPLADAVYASHRATFSAPLVSLGQTPEGCSSLTFPLLMGHARAVELLVLGRKLTAEEAAARGLVTEVWEDSSFAGKLEAAVAAAAALPPQATRKAKALLRGTMLAQLRAANAAEGAVIKGCWLGPEVREAVGRFLASRGSSGGGSGGGGGGSKTT
jgi:peroxisomal 3,2-trans-enoyl-CoA isomerase